ncbi:MAG: SH3 domain-containing protein [Candidatus Zixiibacteriota bacterium]
MKKRFIIFILLLFVFLWYGSALSQESSTSTEADTNFIPQKVYLLDFDSTWEITLKALRENKIPLGNLEKENGIIRSEYQGGPDMVFLGTIFLTRYKYHIILYKESDERTIIIARCIYEVKERSKNDFVEATSLLLNEVIPLEKKLYKIIESYLLPRQGPEGFSPKILEAKEDTQSLTVVQSQSSPLPPLEPPSSEISLPKPEGAFQIPPADSREILPSPASSVAAVVAPPLASKPEPKIEMAKKSLPSPVLYLIILKNANLRTEPTTKSGVITIVKKGRQVKKIGEAGNWVHIQLSWGTMGWISKDLVQEVGP